MYQNKDKILNDKRNEMALLQANYDDLYEHYKIASNNENSNLINDENIILNLLKIAQKEKEDYREKLKDSERSLKQLRIEYYIMEERQGIYKRERDYLEQGKAMLQAEVENSQSLIIRMENHINLLNKLLLPHEFVQRIVEPEAIEMPNFYGSDFKHNSDSSDDDMMADYGSVLISKPADEPKGKINLDSKTSHIDYINFMN